MNRLYELGLLSEDKYPVDKKDFFTQDKNYLYEKGLLDKN